MSRRRSCLRKYTRGYCTSAPPPPPPPPPTPTPPGAPTNLDVTPIDNNSIYLSFTPPTDTGGREITNYTYSIDGTPYIVDPAQTTSPLTITSLEPNIEYTITLSAINEIGTGTASEPFTFTIPQSVSTVFFVDYSNGADSTKELITDTPITVFNSGNFVHRTDFGGWNENTSNAFSQITTISPTWYFPTSSYTLEVWYYWANTTGFGQPWMLIAIRDNNNVNYVMRMNIGSTELEFFYFTLIQGSTDGMEVHYNVPKVLGWTQHIVVLTLGENVKQYINGNLVNTVLPQSPNFWDIYETQVSPNTIQLSGIAGGYKYIKIYDGALDSQEILDLYTNNLPT
jgi:hypothetical protein